MLLAECGVCIVRRSCLTAVMSLGAACARWRGLEQAEELRQLDLLGPDEVVMDAAGSGSKGLEM